MGRRGVKATEPKTHLKNTKESSEGRTSEGYQISERHQDIYPTPWQGRLSHTCHVKVIKPKEYRYQRDTKVYIQPLSSIYYPKLIMQKERNSKNTRTMPRHISNPLVNTYYPTPGTQKQRSSKDTKRTSQECQRNARAYISKDCYTHGTQNQRSPKIIQRMPGYTSDSVTMLIVRRLPSKNDGAQVTSGMPKGYQRNQKNGRKTPEERQKNVRIISYLPCKRNGAQRIPKQRHRDTRKPPPRTSDP